MFEFVSFVFGDSKILKILENSFRYVRTTRLDSKQKWEIWLIQSLAKELGAANTLRFNFKYFRNKETWKHFELKGLEIRLTSIYFISYLLNLYRIEIKISRI